MKVQSITLNSANVHYNNANDETRMYDIQSNVVIQGSSVTNFDSGILKVNGIDKVTFNIWAETLNCSFNDVAIEDQCAMLQAIHDFANSVKESASITTISI